MDNPKTETIETLQLTDELNELNVEMMRRYIRAMEEEVVMAKKNCGNCKHYTLYSKELMTDVNTCNKIKCRMFISDYCKDWEGKNDTGRIKTRSQSIKH